MKNVKLKIVALYIMLINILGLMPINFASGEELKYYRVLTTNSYIYQDKDLTTKLFIVPYSYYVKVERDYGNVLKVYYGESNSSQPQIVGYMPKNALTISENIPLNPYYISKVSTKSSDILFNDNELNKPYFNIPNDSLLVFYGEFFTELGTTLCYCYFDAKLGYIDKASLNDYKIPLNQDPIIDDDFESKPPQNSDKEEINSTRFLINENLQIVIIVGISIICISVVYALFKPTKNKTIENKNELFDEGE